MDEMSSTPWQATQKYSNSADDLRTQTLCEVIQECRRAYGQKPMEDSELSDALPTWFRVLSSIPTANLMPLCTQAIRDKGNNYPVAAHDIFEQWDKPQKAQRKARDSNQSWLSETWHVQMGLRSAEEEQQRVVAFQQSERERRRAYAAKLKEMEAEFSGEEPGTEW